MKIGFTGTQTGMSPEQRRAVKNLIQELKPTEIHHGDCIGADKEFHIFAMFYFPNADPHIHPPINLSKRAYCDGIMHNPKDYLIRNHDIVDSSDVMIATPKEQSEVTRSGTWATIRYAKKIGKKVYIIFPRGTIQE